MSVADAWEQARRAWRRLAANSGRARDDDDGLASLSDIGVVRRILDQAELAAVRAARLHGKSWAEIATHLGVTRQSAWERWRDLDDSPGGGESEPSTESTVLADAASHLLQMRAHEQRRASKVLVPNVIGLEWIQARDVLGAEGLTAINAQPDALTEPGGRGWIITDQSPESGARVPTGSVVRLWLRGDGDAGVREPRRPRPTPRSAREMLPEPHDQRPCGRESGAVVTSAGPGPAGGPGEYQQHDANDERDGRPHLVASLMVTAYQEVHRVQGPGDVEHSENDRQDSENRQYNGQRTARRPARRTR